jgi:Phosphotransferase enzyme family
MKIILDTDNIFEYLHTLNYCNTSDRDTSKITVIQAKNFNLLISFVDGRNLLIKQEIHDYMGKAKGEFWSVWQIHQLMKCHPSFDDKIRDSLPELLHFDSENYILIINYLVDYIDLFDYYTQENQFPVAIAKLIGQLLASIHSQTFQRRDYRNFLSISPSETLDINTTDSTVFQQKKTGNFYTPIDIIHRLSRITPQVFRTTPQECLQFFKLYQRFPSLSQTIIDLGNSISPSCLVHNDLKLNNILLYSKWIYSESKAIKIIDWERAYWGDPAFDVGCILGSYLEIWLDGLTISSALSINESLQLATTPLELLQPSLFNLIQSYMEGFQEIMIARPDFLDRVIQFAGLSLIERVEITIDEDRIFGNRGIVMLQVAKQLICTPQAAINTLFGNSFIQKNV